MSNGDGITELGKILGGNKHEPFKGPYWGDHADNIIFDDIRDAITQNTIFQKFAGSVAPTVYDNGYPLDMPFSNTAGVNGHIVNVPSGYTNVWVRVLSDANRHTLVHFDKNVNGVFSNIDTKQAYLMTRGGLQFPDGTSIGKIPSVSYYCWVRFIMPDKLGGQYMIRAGNSLQANVISIAGNSGFITGLAITKNQFNITHVPSIELHWRTQGHLTPLLNGAVWGTVPLNQPNWNGYAGDIYTNRWFMVNEIKYMCLPQVPNGRDKVLFITSICDIVHAPPTDILVNNISLKELQPQTGLSVLTNIHHPLLDIIQKITLNKGNMMVTCYKIRADIIGNNIYSHLAISTVGQLGIQYFSDFYTADYDL